MFCILKCFATKTVLQNFEKTLVHQFFPYRSTMETDMLSPPRSVGMTVLDKNFFKKVVVVPCFETENAMTQKMKPFLKKILLKIPGIKPIFKENEGFITLLNPELIKEWKDLNEDVQKGLLENGVTEKQLRTREVHLDYRNWNSDDIMRAVLPDGVEIARGFSIIGHIVHLNLRDHLLDYKQLIAQVLLDKVPNVKTVVNKTTKIDNTYRNFSMEVICGNTDLVTQVRENGNIYEFDFGKVYWNPRLSTEHQRLVDSISPNDVLFDVFCGVGPFAIPAAKKLCFVHANDLNPDSYFWLNKNVKLNKIKESYIHTYNKDGGDFIRSDVRNVLLNLSKDDTFCGKTYVSMNLPGLALTFVKHFKDLFECEEIVEDRLKVIAPTISVYFFVYGTEIEKAAKDSFQEETGLRFDEETMSYFFVRNVSTKKDMVKIVFQPPVDFLVKNYQPLPKKKCLDNTL